MGETTVVQPWFTQQYTLLIEEEEEEFLNEEFLEEDLLDDDLLLVLEAVTHLQALQILPVPHWLEEEEFVLDVELEDAVQLRSHKL